MTNIEVQRLIHDNIGEVSKYITLSAIYYPENQTIDLTASCEIKENYILPSNIVIDVGINSYLVFISNQIGLLTPGSSSSHSTDNRIHCKINYKIFKIAGKYEKYVDAKLILRRNSKNQLQSSLLNNKYSQSLPLSDANSKDLKQLYFDCKPNEKFSFNILINGSQLGKSQNYNVKIGQLGPAISSEFNIAKKNVNSISKLTPIKTTIKGKIITSTYPNLKITPGIHEFIVGFDISIFGSAFFSLKI